jgi:geranylgeranyl diphosphate synthase type II
MCYSLENELSAQEIDLIKNKLRENAEIINKRLAEYLDIPGGDYDNLIEAMKYGALSNGKRIRGFLVRECFSAFNKSADSGTAVQIACAIEMIHAYSLIHDDLPCMDDDDMRRGLPSNHKKFGEATALLAGDALLTFAFNVLADTDGEISPEAKIRIISEISQAAGHSGMVGGQTVDMNFENKQIDVIRLIKLHTLKTGALIMAAARAGSIAGGANEESLGLITDYAKNTGLAFQVIDDIFDGDGFVNVSGDKENAFEYARTLTLEALLNLGKLKEINADIDVKTLDILAKYLLYREN